MKVLPAVAMLLCLSGCAAAPVPPVRSVRSAAPIPAPVSAPGPTRVCSQVATSPGSAAGRIVTRVELRGYARLSPDTLCANINMRAGAVMEPLIVRADLQRLWKSGFLEDLVITSETQNDDSVLVYTVHERPVVHEVGWDQGSTPTPLDLAKLAPFSVDTPLDYAALKSYMERLRGALAEHGYRRAQVHFTLTPLGHDNIWVSFHVEAGPRAVISALRFVGAVEASEASLRALLHTSGGKVNVVGAPYDEPDLNNDLAAIQVHLWDLGLISCSPPKLDVQESADGSTVSLTFQIQEGPVFLIGGLRVNGNLAGPVAKYDAAVGLKRGARFSRSAIQAATARLEALHQSLGGHGKLAVNYAPAPDAKTVLDLVWTAEP